MKKVMKWAVCAVAVLTAAACQREPLANEDVNPLYNKETKEVTTQFVLNVAAQSKTKMTAANVQQANNFRGIQDATIFAYSTAGGSNPFVKSTFVTNPGPDPENPVAGYVKHKKFELGTLYTSGAIDNTGDNNDTESSNRILQLNIPINTDAVLFYARATRGSGDNLNETQGKTTMVLSPDPASTVFKVERRIGDDSMITKYNATAGVMIFVINRILHSEILESVAAYNGYEDLPELRWCDLGEQYEINYGRHDRYTGDGPLDRDLSPLEDVLGSCWSNFTWLESGEYRAGSSAAVKAMMKDMYTVINNAASAVPTTALEANAKRLADEIIRRMNVYFTSDWSYAGLSTIEENAVHYVMTQSQWDAQYTGAQDLNHFPKETFHIPEGAAQLDFNNSTKLFSYKNPNKPLVNTNLNSFDPRKYIYPAELLYYTNSALRTTDKGDLRIADYPNGTSPWDDDTSAGNKWTTGNWQSPGVVKSSTRGVAIKNNINYGVSMLKTSVSWSAELDEDTDTLEDNLAATSNNTESSQSFERKDIHFTLTGILVGGVNARYNWQFLRKFASDAEDGDASNDFSKFDGVIYDTDIAASAVPTPTDQETYTLVYDNYDSSLSEGQSNVYVALEFVNNGDSFWGAHNLIPNGGTFYLVASLAPASATNYGHLTWPTNYQVPPINETTGLSRQIPRVFIQDYMTTAKFKIGPNSLKNAYFSVPDLRSSQMSLGLSVDLGWETGYIFDDLVL